MKQTRRPEDKEQLNKTPETPAAADAPQEEPAYSLEEIMNEFGGWTKRDAPAPAEPVTDETVRLAVPAAEAKEKEKPAEPPAGGDAQSAHPGRGRKSARAGASRRLDLPRRARPRSVRPPDPKEARELARAERREKRQAEKRQPPARALPGGPEKTRAGAAGARLLPSPEAAYAFSVLRRRPARGCGCW